MVNDFVMEGTPFEYPRYILVSLNQVYGRLETDIQRNLFHLEYRRDRELKKLFVPPMMKGQRAFLM
jgi:hypothetical protein